MKKILTLLTIALTISGSVFAQDQNSIPSNNIPEEKSNQLPLVSNYDINDFYNKIPKGKSIPNTKNDWYNTFSEYYKTNNCIKNECLYLTKANISLQNNYLTIYLNGYSNKKDLIISVPEVINESGYNIKPIINSTNNLKISEQEKLIAKTIGNNDFNIKLSYQINNEIKNNIQIKELQNWSIIENLTKYDLKNENNTITLTPFASISENISKSDKPNINQEIKIYRLLRETIPYELKTYVEINSIENNSKINLGSLIPKDFVISSIISNNVKINKEKENFIINAQIGKSTLEINSFTNKNLKEIYLPTISEKIVPAELLSVEQTQKYSGIILNSKNEKEIQAIESTATQTVSFGENKLFLKVPENWSKFDSFIVTGSNFSILETNNTSEIQKNENISLNKQSWIGFGDKILQIDQGQYISNSINNEISFLSEIQSAKINDEQVMILKKNDKPYISIQNTNANFEFISEINDFSFLKTLKTNNTSIEEDKTNNWTIFLPPKNKILYYKGASYISDSWQSNWSLYAFFGLTIITFAFYKLFNKKIALIAAISIIFNIENNIISFNMWPALLILMALLKVLTNDSKYEKSNILSLTRVGSSLIFLSFLIYTTSYTLLNIRYFINPSILYAQNINSVSWGASPSEIIQEKTARYSVSGPSSDMAVMSAPVPSAITSNEIRTKIPEAIVNSSDKKQLSISTPKYYASSHNIYESSKEVQIFISPVWLTNIMIIINILFSWLVVLLFASVYFKYNNNKISLFVKNKNEKIHNKILNIFN